MPAIDLVQANEFAFTPSAFIAAYIEQDETTTTTETVSNGGNLLTLPQQINNIGGGISTTPTSFLTQGFLIQTGSVTNLSGILGQSQVPNGARPAVAVDGGLIDLVGQQVTDTRTTSKTITNTKGSASATVVLILSYGTYRSKCVDAQATVALIYSQVAAYLNSL